MYFLGIFQNIGDAIGQSLRSLMGGIIVKIYELIEYMYLLFNYLAKAEILDNSFIAGIYQKVGMILGLFMIFKLTFSLIQSLINPDKFTDKKTGFSQIIMRCVISIVLLGITPSLFREAFKVQNFIVGSSNKNNVIYKLVVGKNVTGDFESMGRVIASNLYFSFFTDEDNNLNKGIKDTIIDNDANYYDRFRTDNYENLVEDVENRNLSFADTLPYLTVQENGKYAIEFDWLLSLLFGVVFLYLMFTYCIQVATRVIQLAYLQLIAPVPILSYISDPDGAFKKWLKQCATTFLDLFIRLAIIYFIIAIIDDVIYQFNQTSGVIFDSTGIPTDDHTLLVIVKIFIILGLLMFAKRVPDLLKDLFPNLSGGAASLGFGLKDPRKMLSDIPLIGKPTEKVLKAGVGAGLIGAGALAANGLHGAANIRKTWKDNKGKKGRFGKTVGAGVKGVFSMAGGAIGGTKIGLKSGLKDNKLANFNRGIAETNANREKRELAGNAGYHWYTPWKPAADKVEAFAGDTTGAEKKIKTAQFRQEALQNSKAIQWQTFAERNSSSGGKADLSLLRSMQEFEEHGKKVWKGIDENGDERTFTYDSTKRRFNAADGGASIASSDEVDIVIKSATIDKQIKEQGKIIKGLELKKNDAEGKK